MKFVAALMLSSCFCAGAASAQQAAAPEEFRVFHLSSSDAAESEAIRLALLMQLSPGSRIWLDAAHYTLLLGATPADIARAEKIVAELDRPKKLYRLTFTITTFESGKKIGDQSYAVVIAMGGRSTLKNGSKVPVVTGSYDTGKQAQETQFTYLDVGINMDLQIDPAEGGARLHSKVEQSSVAEQRAILGAQEPIVRQSVLDSTSVLLLGKPVTLGSLDLVDAPRHLDISVTMEPVK